TSKTAMPPMALHKGPRQRRCSSRAFRYTCSTINSTSAAIMIMAAYTVAPIGVGENTGSEASVAHDPSANDKAPHNHLRAETNQDRTQTVHAKIWTESNPIHAASGAFGSDTESTAIPEAQRQDATIATT